MGVITNKESHDTGSELIAFFQKVSQRKKTATKPLETGHQHSVERTISKMMARRWPLAENETCLYAGGCIDCTIDKEKPWAKRPRAAKN